MTIIVYRDGVMAADTASWSRQIICGHHKKVHKTPDGWLFGCAGALDEIQAFEAWMMAGRQGPHGSLRETSVIRVSPAGVVTFKASEKGSGWMKVTAPWIVIGFGSEFATGCLASDKSAEATVRLALKHIPFIGGEVTTVSLLSSPIKRKSTLRKKGDN